jgi:cytochrome P450
VVRINPREVSLYDPDNYDKIHHVGSKFSKDPNFYSAFLAPTASVTIASNSLHRMRRSVMAPLFSRKAVIDLQSVVRSKVEKFCSRLEEAIAQDRPFDFHMASRAISVDVATDYAFDSCYDMLSEESFGAAFLHTVYATIFNFWLFTQFPLLRQIAAHLPESIATLNSSLAAFVQYKTVCLLYLLGFCREVDMADTE